MATDFFLKIETIPGETIDDKHMDEIRVNAFSWGEAQHSTGGAASDAGHASGRVHAQDFTFSANTSKASPKLILACATGQHIAKAVLSCRKAGETQVDYLVVTMSDVFVSSYQVGGQGHGSDLPGDNVSLNFAKIEVSYCQQDQKGKLGPPNKMGYDFKVMKKI